MTISNNVTRMLTAKKIKFEAHALPEEKLGAVEAANHLGVEAHQVYKTIVAVRTTPGKPILAVIPGDKELDLKLLATAVKEKKIKLATHSQAEVLTGLQTGGISPLALINKGFQVVLDESIRSQDQIFISGGQRGLNIELSPKDLIKLVKGRTAQIA